MTVPEPSPAPASVELGCSEVGEARMDTGRSCTGWASTPLGVVMRVTWVGCMVIVEEGRVEAVVRLV